MRPGPGLIQGMQRGMAARVQLVSALAAIMRASSLLVWVEERHQERERETGRQTKRERRKEKIERREGESERACTRL